MDPDDDLDPFLDHIEPIRLHFEKTTDAVNQLFESGNIDFVVHNDLDNINVAKKIHLATLYRSGRIVEQVQNKQQLANLIEEILSDKGNRPISTPMLKPLKAPLLRFYL